MQLWQNTLKIFPQDTDICCKLWIFLRLFKFFHFYSLKYVFWTRKRQFYYTSWLDTFQSPKKNLQSQKKDSQTTNVCFVWSLYWESVPVHTNNAVLTKLLITFCSKEGFFQLKFGRSIENYKTFNILSKLFRGPVGSNLTDLRKTNHSSSTKCPFKFRDNFYFHIFFLENFLKFNFVPFVATFR